LKDIILPKIFEPFYCKDIIRLGRDHDGGYLVNRQDILKSTRLLSLGVGDDISFEQDFIKINDCQIDAYDGTIEKDVNFFTGDKRKLHIENIGHGIGTTKLSDILSEDDQNVFLKCDIEGSEYEILKEVIVHSHKFSGIVIEFHDAYESPLYNAILNFMSKINLKLVHTHMNNISYAESPNGYVPGCLELSFTSSNNISLTGVSLPHKLDMPNTPTRDDFRIAF